MRFWFSCLIAAALLCSCGGGDDDDASNDASTRDAAIVDGQIEFDGWSGSDAGVLSDSGAFEDGAVALCAREVCDPLEPSSCDDELVCVLRSAGAECVAETGSGEKGAECETLEDCAPGFACFRGPEGGVCERVCCGDDDGECAETERCSSPGTLVDGSPAGWGRCLPRRSCNPLEPEEGCAEEAGCYIVSSAGDTECLLAGDADVGDTCGQQNDCKPGLFCGGLTTRTCARICNVESGGDPECREDEGDCQMYSHSPPGTGLCTL